jgi:hypothetical protein
MWAIFLEAALCRVCAQFSLVNLDNKGGILPSSIAHATFFSYLVYDGPMKMFSVRAAELEQEFALDGSPLCGILFLLKLSEDECARFGNIALPFSVVPFIHIHTTFIIYVVLNSPVGDPFVRAKVLMFYECFMGTF